MDPHPTASPWADMSRRVATGEFNVRTSRRDIFAMVGVFLCTCRLALLAAGPIMDGIDLKAQSLSSQRDDSYQPMVKPWEFSPIIPLASQRDASSTEPVPSPRYVSQSYDSSR